MASNEVSLRIYKDSVCVAALSVGLGLCGECSVSVCGDQWARRVLF